MIPTQRHRLEIVTPRISGLKTEPHQDLLVAIKSFNLLAAASAPMMARDPRMNADGTLDEGSIAAAAFTDVSHIDILESR